MDTVKNGTAKRLSSLDFNIASKTGTSSIGKENIDAYNISYTSEDIVGCWIGKIDNTPINVVGGGEPTSFVKNYLEKIYINHQPKNFTMPSSVVMKEIDLSILENEHVVELAGDYLPERYRQQAIFSRFNLPKTNHLDTLTISPPKIQGMAKNGVAEISFEANEYESYEIYIINDTREELIASLSSKNGLTKFTYNLPTKTIVNFAVKAKVKNYKTNKEILSEFSNVVSLYSPQ